MDQRTCTLGVDGIRARLAWIARLNSRALISARRSGLELVLEYRSLAISDVERLIESERSCCSFLAFQLDKVGTSLLLKIRAQETDRQAAESLFARFSAAGDFPANPAACCGEGGSA